MADGECLDIGLDDGITLAREYTTYGGFELVVVYTECMLRGSEEDDIGGAWHLVILSQLFDVDADHMGQLAEGGKHGINVRLIRNIDEGGT